MMTHHLGSITNEHLHQLRSCQLQEGGIGLCSTCSCQECLPCAWSSVQQHTLGRPDAQLLEAVFVLDGQHNGFNKLLWVESGIKHQWSSSAWPTVVEDKKHCSIIAIHWYNSCTLMHGGVVKSYGEAWLPMTAALNALYTALCNTCRCH